VLACLAAVPAAAQVTLPRLVGTWRLASRIDRDTMGRVIPESGLGADPLGYLIYDAGGHVAVQLMARQRAGAALSPVPVPKGEDPNNSAELGGYDAYFGTYAVDTMAGTVTHTLEGALGPGDVGRRLTRRFRLVGDTLVIWFDAQSRTSQRVTRTLRWVRVSP
jgi:hypothetical protein